MTAISWSIARTSFWWLRVRPNPLFNNHTNLVPIARINSLTSSSRHITEQPLSLLPKLIWNFASLSFKKSAQSAKNYPSSTVSRQPKMSISRRRWTLCRTSRERWSSFCNPRITVWPSSLEPMTRGKIENLLPRNALSDSVRDLQAKGITRLLSWCSMKGT